MCGECLVVGVDFDEVEDVVFLFVEEVGKVVGDFVVEEIGFDVCFIVVVEEGFSEMVGDVVSLE